MNHTYQSTPKNTARRLASALSLAELGWPVFPVHWPLEDGSCSCCALSCKHVGKHPLTNHGFKDATTLVEKIKDWWQEWPLANIGIATGKLSGLVILDIDTKNDGKDTLKQLEEQYSQLPVTVESLTGGGGRHIFFQHPGDCHIVSRAGSLGSGIDIRADGSYIVAPGSLHASGRTYEFEATCHPEDIDIAPLPQWLLEQINLKHQKAAQGQTLWEISRGVVEGRRNISATALVGKLLGTFPVRDWPLAWELLIAWNKQNNQPPLSKEELRVIFDSISGREMAKRCQVKPRINKRHAIVLNYAFEYFGIRSLADKTGIAKSTLYDIQQLAKECVQEQHITTNTATSAPNTLTIPPLLVSRTDNAQ
jgi:hypothetical protein